MCQTCGRPRVLMQQVIANDQATAPGTVGRSILVSLNIYLFDKLYNTIQYNTIQYNTIQYNTIQCNTIQYNTIQYNTMQCNKYSTIQHNTIQYNTIQNNTIQRVYKLGSGKKPVGLIQIRFPSDVNCNECELW